MMRATILVGILLFCFCSFSKGQGEKYINVRILLQNNQVLDGYMLNTKIEENVVLFFSFSDSLTVPVSMVKKITIEPNLKVASDTSLVKSENKIGYFNNSNFGLLYGESDNKEFPNSAFSLETINGVRIFPYLNIGIGIGYDQYGSTRIIPLFLSIRGDLLKKKFTPFYFADFGGGAAKDTFEEDGNFSTKARTMSHLGLGVKLYSDNHINIMFSVGYKKQNVLYEYDNNWGGLQETERNFNRLSIRLGIGF